MVIMRSLHKLSAPSGIYRDVCRFRVVYRILECAVTLWKRKEASLRKLERYNLFRNKAY